MLELGLSPQQEGRSRVTLDCSGIKYVKPEELCLRRKMMIGTDCVREVQGRSRQVAGNSLR